MLEQLKQFAMDQMSDKMQSNPLNSQDTTAAAEEGAGSIISSLTEKLGSGGLDQIKDLFSGSNEGMEQNDLFQSVKDKFSGVLENKGMNAADAQNEASSVLPGIISSLKDKFQSEDEADKGFDLSSISSLTEGGIGGLMDKAKGFFN